mgnify:CR=1 FL=1
MPPLDVRTVPTTISEPDAIPNVPNPDPVRLSELEWKVLTPSTIPEGEWVYIALTPQQYEVLSQNQAELLRWITEAAWRLKYYRGELASPILKE